MEGTAEPPLPVEHFDPNAALPEVMAFAGPGAELLTIEATYVKSSGHLDLTADYRPRLQYEFIRPRSDHETGPVGTGTRDRKFERVSVSLREPTWMHVETRGGGCERRSGTFKHQGMARDVQLVGEREALGKTQPPACDMGRIWQLARETSSAPADAVAQIEYSGAGYSFSIRDLDIELFFDPDCSPTTEERFDAAEDDLRRTPEERAERAARDAARAARDAAREIRRAEREAQMRRKSEGR